MAKMVEDKLNSALIFRPGAKGVVRNMRLVEANTECLTQCRFLAETTGKEVRVLYQHSLLDDEFAMLVDTDGQSFHFHSRIPENVFRLIASAVETARRRFGEQQEAERASREEDGLRSRRLRSTRKRGDASRKRRRSTSRRSRR